MPAAADRLKKALFVWIEPLFLAEERKNRPQLKNCANSATGFATSQIQISYQGYFLALFLSGVYRTNRQIQAEPH
jgi:hypothetical protein